MKSQTTPFKLMARNKGKWIDPVNDDVWIEGFQKLFYAGLCERQLNPKNYWSYQYRIAK